VTVSQAVTHFALVILMPSVLLSLALRQNLACLSKGQFPARRSCVAQMDFNSCWVTTCLTQVQLPANQAFFFQVPSIHCTFFRMTYSCSVFELQRVMHSLVYTPLAVVSRPQDSMRMNRCYDNTKSAVSSKEGAVIGAVLSTRKFHRGHH
jgi:hypothetical protein